MYFENSWCVKTAIYGFDTFASDELGSTTHVIDEAGKILNRYEYDAFGNFTVKEETVTNRFCFTGEQYDPASNLYYLRARFYSPVIGRFLNEDTYYGDGLNLYAYCHNNPLTYVDPTGHWCEKKQQETVQKYKDKGYSDQDAETMANYERLREEQGVDAAEKYLQEQVRGSESGSGSKFKDVFDLADNYNLSDDTFNNHILDRHGPNSLYGNKSHFNADFDIKNGIDSTLKGDNFIIKSNTAGRDGYIFEQTFTNPIGTNSKGKPLYTIKVVIDEFGNVVTAFPKK